MPMIYILIASNQRKYIFQKFSEIQTKVHKIYFLFFYTLTHDVKIRNLNEWTSGRPEYYFLVVVWSPSLFALIKLLFYTWKGSFGGIFSMHYLIFLFSFFFFVSFLDTRKSLHTLIKVELENVLSIIKMNIIWECCDNNTIYVIIYHWI